MNLAAVIQELVESFKARIDVSRAGAEEKHNSREIIGI